MASLIGLAASALELVGGAVADGCCGVDSSAHADAVSSTAVAARAITRGFIGPHIIRKGGVAERCFALTVGVTDWSGHDYAEISSLQRAMAAEAVAALAFKPNDRVLDVGCGDGYITRSVAAMVPGGCAVGLDASPRMVAAALAGQPGLFRFTQMRVLLGR
jgi:SAM-dependent methyltransferase